VGSPVKSTKQELEDLGKQLKKNSISIDIISFGDPNTQENEEKLQALLGAANNVDESGKDNSHYVPVPSGNLSEALSQMTGGTQGGAATSELDPELAWAMELSKQSYERENKSDTDVDMKDAPAAPATPATSASAPAPAPATPLSPDTLSNLGIPLDEDDADLLAALKMSMQDDPDLLEVLSASKSTALEDQQRETQKTNQTPTKTENQTPNQSQNPASPAATEDIDMSAIDDNTIENVLSSLPVDKDDPEFQKLLQSFKKDEK